jgi:AraC-like DNA-binding protein
MARALRTFFRYLPVSEASRAWGFYVFNVGATAVPPGSPYPPVPHPEDHAMTWRQGRVLQSPCFVYITRGRGTFESAPSGEVPIRGGNLFVLYPGVRHRYAPDPAVGWDEAWMEFDGASARQFMRREEFAPEKPVLEVGIDETLVRLFREQLECVRQGAYGFEYQLAGLAVQIIARVLALAGGRRFQDEAVDRLIARAKDALLEDVGRNADLPALAARFHVSYTRFRRVFKDYTGFSPRQYQIQHRIEQAGGLLAATRLPVGAIADRLGFESVYYFSKLFKRKTGLSPLAFRRRAQAR